MHHKQWRETVTNAPCSCPRPKNGGKPAIECFLTLQLLNCPSPQHTHQSVSFSIHHPLSSKMIPRIHSFILQILWLDLLPNLYFIIWSSLLFDTQQFEFRFNPFLSYEAIINAYVQAQLLKHSLFYFSQMINKGLTPGPNTYIIFWVFLSNQIVLRKLCVFSMKQRGIFKWMYVVLGLWLKVVGRLWFV